MRYKKNAYADSFDNRISFWSTDDNVLCQNGELLKDNLLAKTDKTDIGLLGNLVTNQKTNIVLAINEIKNQMADKLEIADAFTWEYKDLKNKPKIPGIEGLATEEYVGNKIAEVINSAPEQLDTLRELSQALNNDANFAATINNALAEKADMTYVNTELAQKIDKVEGKDLFSGDYNDLKNRPVIPTTVSALANDTGFITDTALEPYLKIENMYTKEEIATIDYVNRHDNELKVITIDENKKLQLTTDKWQTVNLMQDGTEILLPENPVELLEVHLKFAASSNVTVILPSAKYQSQPDILIGRSYEYIFNYYGGEWIAGVIVYG